MRHPFVLLVLLLVAGCAATPTVTYEPSYDQPSYDQPSTPAATTAPRGRLPAPKDFTISIRVLGKACFGSAGCNITYRVEPTYRFAGSAATTTPVTVIYEVTGGESGPRIDNFTYYPDGSFDVPREDFISTKSSAVTLKAAATSVTRG